MSSQPINYSCVLPCCCSPSVEQTDGLCGARLLALVLGIISLVIGILILSGVSDLHTLGTAAGGVFLGTGFVLICIGLCLNCGPKKSERTFLTQVREDYVRQQQLLMQMEQSTIKLLHELQTPESYQRQLPPQAIATLNDLLSDVPSTIPRFQNDSLLNPLPVPPTQNATPPPLFSERPADEKIKIVQYVLRLGELTDQLEDAIKKNLPTDVIEKQLIQEGIDPEVVAQKIAIATFKLKLSNQ